MGAKGLEVILNAIDANDSDSDVLNVTSAILELISAYLGIIIFLSSFLHYLL